MESCILRLKNEEEFSPCFYTSKKKYRLFGAAKMIGLCSRLIQRKEDSLWENFL